MKKFLKILLWFLALLPVLIIIGIILLGETEAGVIFAILYAFLIFTIWSIVRSRKRGSLLSELKRVRESNQNRESAGPVTCPKCNSVSITANQKGFGVGKAVVGVSLFGLPGILAGNIGRRKIRVTCLSCGYSWWVK